MVKDQTMLIRFLRRHDLYGLRGHGGRFMGGKPESTPPAPRPAPFVGIVTNLVVQVENNVRPDKIAAVKVHLVKFWVLLE